MKLNYKCIVIVALVLVTLAYLVLFICNGLHVLLNFSTLSEVNYYNECYSLIYTIGEFCTVPITLRVLSWIILAHLALYRKDIGYELIAEHEVETIACTGDQVK